MAREIEQFAKGIGAAAPEPGDDDYGPVKALFRRPNYFLMSGTLLIVKISRSSPPFWGVRKKIVDLVNSLENYYLVLLVSESEGWVFSKGDVNLKINSGKWKPGHDNEYKINLPLEDRFSFSSPRGFRTKLALS